VLDVGNVLGTTFRSWLALLLPFSAIGYLALGPIHVLGYLLSSPQAAESAQRDPGAALAGFLAGLVNLILTGAYAFGVFQHLHGDELELGPIIGTGIVRAVPVFGVGLLQGLATTAACCFFVLPMFYVGAMLSVAIPVAVIEKPGLFKSLSRSQELTKGNLARIMGASIVVGMAIWAPAFLAGVGLALASHGASPRGLSLALELLFIPLQPLQGILGVVLYQELRQGKEGTSLDELLSVFA
jgi:thiamine transporter ThiT